MPSQLEEYWQKIGLAHQTNQHSISYIKWMTEMLQWQLINSNFLKTPSCIDQWYSMTIFNPYFWITKLSAGSLIILPKLSWGQKIGCPLFHISHGNVEPWTDHSTLKTHMSYINNKSSNNMILHWLLEEIKHLYPCTSSGAYDLKHLCYNYTHPNEYRYFILR